MKYVVGFLLVIALVIGVTMWIDRRRRPIYDGDELLGNVYRSRYLGWTQDQWAIVSWRETCEASPEQARRLQVEWRATHRGEPAKDGAPMNCGWANMLWWNLDPRSKQS